MKRVKCKTVMINSFSHPCEVIEGMTDVWDVWVVTGAAVWVLTGIGIDVLADMNVNVLEAMTTALELALLAPWKESIPFAWTAISCWPMALLDCARVLQAWMPSYHVWSSLALSALPQFLNQEPPRPQQLLLPDFLMVPHLRHSGLTVTVVVVAADVSMCEHWS